MGSGAASPHLVASALRPAGVNTCQVVAEDSGAVYRARRADDSVVAVKDMLSRVDADDAAIEKFKREVAVTSGLRHPNIIRVLDNSTAVKSPPEDDECPRGADHNRRALFSGR